MGSFCGLFDLLAKSADRSPQRTAVEETECGSIGYDELTTLTGQKSPRSTKATSAWRSKRPRRTACLPWMTFFHPNEPLVLLQLLAYDIANWRGWDVDKPRNVANEVTVKCVVA